MCGKGGHAWQRGGACVARGTFMAKGACMAKGDMCGRGHAWEGKLWWGYAWQGGMHGRGHEWHGYAWQGLCMAGGMHGRGACMPGEMATAADGRHPTGMHSCLTLYSLSTYSFLYSLYN